MRVASTLLVAWHARKTDPELARLLRSLAIRIADLVISAAVLGCGAVYLVFHH